MSRKIGLITEGKSDRDVVEALMRKIVLSKRFKVVPVYARGCGRIKSKCRRWAENLRSRGCKSLILVHDLDNKDLGILRNDLESSLQPSPISPYGIVVPVQMIEAWLLSDGNAIKQVFDLPSTPEVSNPESIFDPKAKLRDMVYTLSGKRYVNTIHNLHIASALEIEKVRTCPSFRQFDQIMQSIL